MLKKQKGLFKWKLCSGHSLRSWRDKRGSVGFFWRGIRENGEYTSQLQVKRKRVSKMALKKGVTNFHLEYPTGKIQCRTNFNF